MYPVKMALLLALAPWASTWCGEALFEDQFPRKLAEGWCWVREDPQAWRLTDRGLEIRVQPGNMWGAANNARNVLVRPLGDGLTENVEITLMLENQPTEQYEQVDLVWYYDDSHMVKLGQELVDAKLSVVMGREFGDKTRTIAIKPLSTHSLQVRFRVSAGQIRGEYLPGGATEWLEAGRCDLPAPPNGHAKVSIQCYQGPAAVEHWARLSRLRIAPWKP